MLVGNICITALRPFQHERAGRLRPLAVRSVGPALAAVVRPGWRVVHHRQLGVQPLHAGQQCRDVRGRSMVAELTYRETRALLPDDAHPAKPEPAGARL